jgi:hypothetical protein
MNHIPNLHDLERMHGVTWNELIGLGPRLNELLWQARAAGANCDCREDMERVFSPIRNALSEVLGFRSGHMSHPVLGSVGAYEVAYWRLHDAIGGLLPQTAAVQETEKQAVEAAPQRRWALAPAGFSRLIPALRKLATLVGSPGLDGGAFPG